MMRGKIATIVIASQQCLLSYRESSNFHAANLRLYARLEWREIAMAPLHQKLPISDDGGRPSRDEGPRL
jgi:hypothetical protein